ncbi:MAG: hypothetical protein ABR549_10070, partial [Mycobacteriales bacterium]
VNHALDLVLGHQEPFPAFVVDRGWDLVRANDGATLLLEDIDQRLLPNVMRMTLHPDGIAPRILDFEVLAGHLVSRLKRQVALTGDEILAELVDEVASYRRTRPGALDRPPRGRAAGAAAQQQGGAELLHHGSHVRYGERRDPGGADRGVVLPCRRRDQACPSLTA